MVKILDKEWMTHWIYDHIPQETIDSMKFSEWMWCPERYSDEVYQYLASLWDERKYGDK